MLNNLRFPEGRKSLELLRTIFGTRPGFMYSGDVYDTPPVWLRVLFALAVLAGGTAMLVYLAGNGHAIPVIVTVFAIALVEYLLFTVPKAANLGAVAAGFLIYIGVLALFLPVR